MDWVNAIEKAIQYIENHLVEDITVKDVAKYVHISEFYLAWVSLSKQSSMQTVLYLYFSGAAGKL